MRTTIDIPDALLSRAKPVLARQGLTLRAVMIDALERVLSPSETQAFRLRDASAGQGYEAGGGVTNEQIESAIDELREPSR